MAEHGQKEGQGKENLQTKTHKETHDAMRNQTSALGYPIGFVKGNLKEIHGLGKSPKS